MNVFGRDEMEVLDADARAEVRSPRESGGVCAGVRGDSAGQGRRSGFRPMTSTD